jgi:hypothetical protein
VVRYMVYDMVSETRYSQEAKNVEVYKYSVQHNVLTKVISLTYLFYATI